MANNITLQTLARVIVAARAYQGGEIQFASQVLAGAWDHTNRDDIREVYRRLSEKPSEVEKFFAAITAGM